LEQEGLPRFGTSAITTAVPPPWLLGPGVESAERRCRRTPAPASSLTPWLDPRLCHVTACPSLEADIPKQVITEMA
jgi:hypothetical protein